ncbi:MAG: FAD-dependent oxidoreductase, partial [Lachnospiraceae bacterium]|nr:FAD-dependent oxidoreductase [Lachnospiraceae bacterium]
MAMLRGRGMEDPVIKMHEADFCVVGGGLAGFCAALSAARHGSRVVLMQDRPMLGGNASSEIRMWIRGSDGADMRETGIVEELNLENIYRNPDMNFSLLDGVFYGMAKKEKNLTLLLNCTCFRAEMNGNRILSVTGWQLTTQVYHQVRAAIFADCSGDSVLAPLTGAGWRMGR